MKDKFRKCSTCAFFEWSDDKGWCSIQELYTFVEDDDICEEYILDKEIEEDIKSGVWR